MVAGPLAQVGADSQVLFSAWVDLVIREWVEHGGDERKIGRRFAASDVHAGGIQVEG